MRGSDAVAGSLFSYVDLEKRVRADHPLRVIRGVVNATLADLSVAFDALYSPFGRESIPPERLLRALLLQAFYSIRSERQLVERIEFDLLFRWFVGLGVDDPVWDATTFTKNRDRLLEGDVALKFLATVLAQPKVKALLSTEHFSVDGTLLEAWASTKSFRPKDGSAPPPGAGRNGEQDFHGQKRSNESHASTTDPDARLYRKGREVIDKPRSDRLLVITPSVQGSNDLRVKLGRLGFATEIAASARDALGKLRSANGRFDCVLLSDALAVGNLGAVIEELHAVRHDLPVLILHAGDAARLKADHAAKPCIGFIPEHAGVDALRTELEQLQVRCARP